MPEQVFVARERELSQLQTFLDRALAGQGQVVFITGEAGAGKTALVAEFARRAQERHDDLLVAIGDCNAHAGIGDPYLPFREVLGLLTGDVETRLAHGGIAITRENAGRLRNFLHVSGQVLVDLGPDLIDIFIPGMGLATRAGAFVAGRAGWLERLEDLLARKAAGAGGTDPSTGSGQGLDQSRTFEQYTDVLQALAAQQPLVLVLDDLQWADAASISLLFHLGRSIGESRILILGSYRPDEVALGRAGRRHPLEKVLGEFKRYFGDIRVDLDEAAESEGRQFVDALLDAASSRLGEDFRQALFRRTGGHPLFTIELLWDMQERGDLVQDEQGRWVEGPALDWAALPARVEGVIEERIGRLEGELWETLAVASVEGEEFTAQVVARVRETDERDVVRQLSRELGRKHRLVGERGTQRVGQQRLYLYHFRHILFQQHLYHGLREAERELLHGDVGVVLEELYGEQAGEIAPRLAWHFAEAGEVEKAVGYLLQAGDRARGLFAYQEAIDHYQRALGFLKEQGEYEQAARTLMKLGLTYHISFDFRRARQAYAEGFELWQRAGEMAPAVPPPPAPHALRADWSHTLTLDPTIAGDAASAGVIDQLFSGLVELGTEMDVVPAVARTWEVSEAGRRYIFHLRDNARWSDGTPVTAEDFEYAWKRVLDPVTGSPSASLLYDVKGARAFHQGEVSDPGRVEVRAVDRATLVVELEGPTSYFPHLLTCCATYPVPRHVVEAHGEAWAEAGNIVTNGPFRLETWQQGESMVLVRNATYHGRFTGNVQQVELFLVEDPSVRLEMYEAGDLDTVSLWGLPPPAWDRARQRYGGEFVSVPRLHTLYVGFDVGRAPFDDPRVRRALVHAVDRETLADVVMRGYISPATGGFLPPGMPAHSREIGLPYDPHQARQLLVEAGYPQGRGFPVVNLLTFHGVDPVSEYLLAQWQTNLGIEIAWESMEAGMFFRRLSKDPPHMFLSGNLADYPDPDDFLRVSPHVGRTRWRNEAYDDLVAEARRVTDQGERMKMYQQADRILVEEAAIMPLTYGRLNLLVKPWIRRFPTSPSKVWFWKDVTIEPH